jgi:hypothetical protein
VCLIDQAGFCKSSNNLIHNCTHAGGGRRGLRCGRGDEVDGGCAEVCGRVCVHTRWVLMQVARCQLDTTTPPFETLSNASFVCVARPHDCRSTARPRNHLLQGPCPVADWCCRRHVSVGRNVSIGRHVSVARFKFKPEFKRPRARPCLGDLPLAPSGHSEEGWPDTDRAAGHQGGRAGV